MKTGARFWQLIGLVFIILIGYALAELHDDVTAKEMQFNSLQQLLFRQQALLRDNHWIVNLRSVEKIRQAWLDYLPDDDSAAVAKANLLRNVRAMGKNAGVAGLTVRATDAEFGEKTNNSTAAGGSLHPGYGSKSAAAKLDTLPLGVQMIKLQVTGRFEPVAFAKLLRALKEERRSSIIERVSVRGAQLDLNMRYYWRLNTDNPVTITRKANAQPVAGAF